MALFGIFLLFFIFLYRYTKISSVRYSLRHPIDKVGSITSFSSENVFPNVSLSAKKLKLFINANFSKENENNVDATE